MYLVTMLLAKQWQDNELNPDCCVVTNRRPVCISACEKASEIKERKVKYTLLIEQIQRNNCLFYFAKQQHCYKPSFFKKLK